MISKQQIKSIRSLHQKKYRDEAGLFIAEGPKVVSDLAGSKFRVKEVFAIKGFELPAVERAVIREVSERELESISALSTPNQVLAVCEMPDVKADISVLKHELVLALDDIRDPGNLGTIIRIADWFGIHHILCSESCVDVFGPKVIQSTMGSIARVNVYYEDLNVALKKFKDIYAAVLDGENIYSQKLPARGIVLIGNESKGVSEKLLKLVTHKISIPKFSSGADSLNAAIATAVICSEFKRRQSSR